MNEHAWILFWKCVLGIGLGSYLLLALAIVPLGLRDIFRLFRNLDQIDSERKEAEETAANEE